ncbi:unnamed protein product [Knipowitschia caucasica]|uniref:C-factor-like n=1 Tax=Knipowitschia caucasica TaxID=637954 RepID=A0AAV2KJF8_KNICA
MFSKAISVLITGVNRGLGLEMVRQMVEIQKPPPRLLFACCRDPDGATHLQALKKEHPDIIKIIHLDAADPTSIKQAAAQVGSILGTSGLNLIINNAAVAVHQSLFDSTPEDMHRSFNTNTIGPMLVIQEFIPFLRAAAKDCGSPGLSCCKAAVINISTFCSSNELTKESYKEFAVMPYRVSKAALNMLSVCASLELQKHEILCAMLHPGWVRTDMGGKDGELSADESVEGMLHVMSSMTEQHCGTLQDWRGQTVPW